MKPSLVAKISSSKDTVDSVIFWWHELLHNDASQYQVWKQNAWWFRRYHLNKNLHFDLHCDLDPECSNPIFFHRKLWLLMMYHQTKFGCQEINSSNNMVERVIFWLYKPSLWPWHWAQWANFSAWHFGLWCCITIPGLATKWSVVQQISSGQTFTNNLNRRCDLHLEGSNPIFAQNIPAYDAVLSNQVWVQTDQQFRTYK